MDCIGQPVQNADFFPLRGLETDAFWLSFVEKKGAVKAAMIDTDALIKVITQGSVYALAFVAQGCHLDDLTAKFLDSGRFLKPLAVKE